MRDLWSFIKTARLVVIVGDRQFTLPWYIAAGVVFCIAAVVVW